MAILILTFSTYLLAILLATFAATPVAILLGTLLFGLGHKLAHVGHSRLLVMLVAHLLSVRAAGLPAKLTTTRRHLLFQGLRLHLRVALLSKRLCMLPATLLGHRQSTRRVSLHVILAIALPLTARVIFPLTARVILVGVLVPMSKHHLLAICVA